MFRHFFGIIGDFHLLRNIILLSSFLSTVEKPLNIKKIIAIQCFCVYVSDACGGRSLSVRDL